MHLELRLYTFLSDISIISLVEKKQKQNCYYHLLSVNENVKFALLYFDCMQGNFFSKYVHFDTYFVLLYPVN